MIFFLISKIPINTNRSFPWDAGKTYSCLHWKESPVNWTATIQCALMLSTNAIKLPEREDGPYLQLQMEANVGVLQMPLIFMKRMV